MRRRGPLLAIICARLLALPRGSGHAGEAVLATPAPSEESTEAPANEPPSISSSIPAMGQFKKVLLERGFEFQVNYTGNPMGGARQCTIYDGLLEMAVDANLDKVAGLSGAWFHINAYQIHGVGLSTHYIFNYTTVSSIEARPSTRLFEAWF